MVAMGTASLREEVENGTLLKLERRSDRQQTGYKLTALLRPRAKTEFASNHRWPEGTLRHIIGGFNALMVNKRPEGHLLLEELATGAHRLGQGSLLPIAHAEASPLL